MVRPIYLNKQGMLQMPRSGSPWFTIRSENASYLIPLIHFDTTCASPSQSGPEGQMHVPSMVEIGVRHLPARFGRRNSENADVEELLTSINTTGLNTAVDKNISMLHQNLPYNTSLAIN
jgi:hypothetical protein